MIAQGRFNPAHLGAIGETVRCVLAELGAECFEPGDVVVHNDPFRGGCHMPEHMLLRPVFYERRAASPSPRRSGTWRRSAPSRPARSRPTATEVYQEGLRLPPVKLVRAASRCEDVWKIILSNHRTPRSTWGDLHAMIGSLELADRRLHALLDRHGARARARGLGRAARPRRAADAAADRGDPRRRLDVRGCDGGRRHHARAGDDARPARRSTATARSSTTRAPTRRRAGRSTPPTASPRRRRATRSSR